MFKCNFCSELATRKDGEWYYCETHYAKYVNGFYDNVIGENVVNDVQPITRDLVNDLRLRGEHTEADNLVKAHQESLKTNKVQEQKEIQRGLRLIRKNKLNKNNLCMYCTNEIHNDTDTVCRFCKKIKRIRNMIDTVIRNENDTGVVIRFRTNIDFQEFKKTIKKYNRRKK